MRSAPMNDSISFEMRVEISTKEDEAKMRKDIARVNMMDVLLFLYL